MPEASGSGSAPDGSLLAADESSSPITQVSALNVASDAPPQSSAPPPRRGFVAALLRCCGRMPDEGADHSQRALSRTLYIPPAPHTGQPFIPPLLESDKGKKTLVLDLDETLVHSSFKPVPNPDYIIPVEIDGKARWRRNTTRRAPQAAPRRA
jgi:RNA polymerase II subunit A small phosphatase-like protein